MQTRLLAILLTDLSGYTRFSATADRKDIAAAVRQQQAIIQPLIDAFHGTLVKWIGDAALATFGSAIDALLCGWEIQQAFIGQAERGRAAIEAQVKVVVHAGDVMVDRDGDIYGDAVNFAARMEKAADADGVYFSDAVRRVISRAEIPHERAGEFEFKGIAEKATVWRTCFARTPLVRERVALVQTNFVGVHDLADRHTWDHVHPVIDDMTGAIIDAARAHGGACRGSLQVGTFLVFGSVAAALAAARDWSAELGRVGVRPGPDGGIRLKVRTGIHRGTLHVMKHTMMGRDIDVVQTLAALGLGDEILLTGEAVAAARAEGLPAGPFAPAEAGRLRACANRTRWEARFRDCPVFVLRLSDLPGLDLQAGAGTPPAETP